MTKLIFIPLFFLASEVYAGQKSVPTPTSREARFFYFERIPNYKKPLYLNFPTCTDSTEDPLQLEIFESKKTTQSGDVNVLSIYARLVDCEKSGQVKRQQRAIKTPANQVYTHVYLTVLSPKIQVE